MIPIDLAANAQVRQRYAANCLALSRRIIALQARNEEISDKLDLLIAKGKAFSERWAVD